MYYVYLIYAFVHISYLCICTYILFMHLYVYLIYVFLCMSYLCISMCIYVFVCILCMYIVYIYNIYVFVCISSVDTHMHISMKRQMGEFIILCADSIGGKISVVSDFSSPHYLYVVIMLYVVLLYFIKLTLEAAQMWRRRPKPVLSRFFYILSDIYS